MRSQSHTRDDLVAADGGTADLSACGMPLFPAMKGVRDFESRTGP
jgi:hypothetical protein